MQASDNDMANKLLNLMTQTGYPIVQHNGQRKFGPPPGWNSPPPQRGCEIFVGKLPREIFEDELIPIFARIGKIYEFRLMMDFSGSNRGYAFVTYTNKNDALRAVRELNSYEIKPGRHIGVVKSVDNCRLFIGNIPKTKTKEEIFEGLSQIVPDIVDVVLYKNCCDRRLNRGYAFVEFSSHRSAAMARRTLVPGFTLWGSELHVDWADPEPDIDDDLLSRVKVLYARNFLIKTTPESIQSVFENAIGAKVERVKKIYDYAFIHFFERKHAETAMAKLQNADIDGSNIEIKWAKPVDRDLYKIQKTNRGNAKFNCDMNISQKLFLDKQHLEKKEYEGSAKEDEGIGSVCAGQSSCGSPSNSSWFGYPTIQKEQYLMWPGRLESMCKRYLWAPPIYDYQRYIDPAGNELWVGSVKLPHVGLPLLNSPRCIGPLLTRACYSIQQALSEAAGNALHYLKALRADVIQKSTVQPIYHPLVSPVPSCIPYDYTSLFPHSPQPVPMPIWRTA